MFKTTFFLVCALASFAPYGFAFDGGALPPGAVGEMPEAPRPNELSPLECTSDINQWGYSSACNCPTDYSYLPSRGVCVLGEKSAVEAGLFGGAPTKGNCSNSSGSIKLTVDT